MPCKLYAWTNMHFFLYACQIAAHNAGVECELVVVPMGSEESKEPAFVAKKAHGKFPFLETEDGTIIFESVAIARYFAAKGDAKMLGENAFQAAKVDQWTSYATCTLDSILRAVVYNVFGFADTPAVYDEKVNALSAQLIMMEKYMQGRQWFATNDMSVADIVMFGGFLQFFTYVIGKDQQKNIPNLCKWYDAMRQHPSVVKVCGLYKFAEEAFPIAGATAKVNCAPAAEAEEEEMDDLFGDEDSDEEAAAEARDHAAMLRGKAFEAKKKAAAEAAGKVAPEAKSLILWEVKPVDDETDLDALAKRILAITNEKGGLFWKTEYKKAPIAFGIFKLIIGATIHDNLVSTDDIQE